MTFLGKVRAGICRHLQPPGQCRNCIAGAVFRIRAIVGVRRGKNGLPYKICPRCQRPFSWRKKWERCWEEVRYCSDACRKGTPRGRRASTGKAVSV